MSKQWSDEEREAIHAEFLTEAQAEKPWATAVLAANLTVALLDARAEAAELKAERDAAFNYIAELKASPLDSPKRAVR